MAVTKGHGNPKWTRDEVILALDLYFACAGKMPSPKDRRIIELSEILRAFPHHALAARKTSFRNPDGVAFKLQNLRQLDTGEGLGNVSQVDRAVWSEFIKDRERVKTTANLIREGINVINETHSDDDLQEFFSEGRVLTETHLRRERDLSLRTRLLQQRKSKGELCCEICDWNAATVEPTVVDACFEAHHILPLCSGERKTKLSDLALLCACCHRMIHCAITKNGRWVSIEEAKRLISTKATIE